LPVVERKSATKAMKGELQQLKQKLRGKMHELPAWSASGKTCGERALAILRSSRRVWSGIGCTFFGGAR
jgi:hypothetical protein